MGLEAVLVEPEAGGRGQAGRWSWELGWPRGRASRQIPPPPLRPPPLRPPARHP